MLNDFHIKDDETIEDLQYNNLHILQKKHGFRFGMDPVLLSYFVIAKKNYNIVDIGTGSGIISILISQQAQNLKITAIELQSEIAEMANRSVELNNLSNIISLYNDSFENINKYVSNNSQDIVVSNPPYSKSQSAVVSSTKNKLLSRHEQEMSFDSLVKIAYKILKLNGKFVFCFPTTRLVEAISTLRENRMEPKRLRLVHSHIDKAPYIFLMEASKCGKPFLKVMPPLVCYTNGSNMTEELKKIYHIKKSY